ncbi:quinone oxidoreductase family protein [Micromonospora vulcania]|uniref:Zinc-binding alcohol dehydrogenase family protein n=1 Tax=Micromonospora vulcania TaxID=1441873 RepID=A0ABW1H465_9ACTN
MSSTAQRWVPGGGRDGELALHRLPLADPGAGEITIAVRAVGMNAVDALNASSGASEIGYEVSGTIEALGPDVTGHDLGEDVLSFRVHGGYTTAITVPARDVFTKPTALGWAEAANLLLVGSAAAEMLHRTELADGDVVLVHGASGAVGISAVQQAKLRGARVIGTASPRNWDLLRRFGAEPVAYGAGLEQRVRDLTEHVDVAFDAVGTDEAVDVSLALVADRRRIASSAAFDRAGPEGFWIVGHETGSVTYRDQVREHLIELAGTGRLTVPMARTFPFAEALAALDLVASGHPGGKVALLV